MKTIINIALKNILRSGLKTWLNSIAISFAFVFIILYFGMVDGWHNQAKYDAIK